MNLLLWFECLVGRHNWVNVEQVIGGVQFRTGHMCTRCNKLRWEEP